MIELGGFSTRHLDTYLPSCACLFSLQGWVSKAHAGWVRIDHPQGYWMPIAQHGHDVIHFKK